MCGRQSLAGSLVVLYGDARTMQWQYTSRFQQTLRRRLVQPFGMMLSW